MKKILLSIIAVCSLFMTIQFTREEIDAASMSASGPSTVTVGQNFTVTFNLSASGITSGSITILHDSNLELISGEWVLSGTTLANFDGQTGAAAFTEAKNISGGYFRVTFKANAVSSNSVFSASAELKNGITIVDNANCSYSVKVICSSHSWGEWKQTDPTCTAAGSKTHTCSVCGTSETVSIDALGHDVQDWQVTVQPTCTEAGKKEAICSRCHQSTAVTIPALGHDFNTWATLEPATCCEHGLESHKCKECGFEETRETDFAEHTIGDDYVILIEPTVSNYGLAEATCSVCGEKFQKQLLCIFIDESNNVEYTFEEGTFPADTVIEFSFIEIPDEIENAKKDAGDALLSANSTESALDVQIQNLGQMSSGYKIFSLVAKCNERVIQPSKSVNVTMDVPEDFSEFTTIVKLNEDGTMELLGTTILDGKIKFDLEEFGDYAIVNLKNITQEDALPFYFLYLLVGSGALIVVLSILLLSQKRMRK